MIFKRQHSAFEQISMLGGDTESHINSGFWLLNSTRIHEVSAGTVVVAGLGRSGTSMLAAVLKAAGISMGEQTATATHEDQRIASLLQPRRRRELQSLIRERNEKHHLWGFKLPSRQVLEPSLFRMLRRPFVMVIFRDILAIAGRRQVSRGENLQSQLTQSLREYQRLVSFLARIQHPCLLISYEKALLDPDFLVAQIDQFLDLRLDSTSRERCKASIQVSPEIYRREVRDQRGWQGRLEEVHRDKILGWAFVEQAHTPAQVEIWINGSCRHSCLADQPRLDVQKEHKLKTSACGFCIDLDDPLEHLNPGDHVSARMAGTGQQLRNSPQSLVQP